ncbi:response regulator transcription factor [Pedobacter polaris]|uniref:Response regulator transcription factor n=1 Tax=Pedobacter polaris TaxID=2571273 RepID=A0A4U1CSG4_9SPHI|nr:LytTR family DNA-binding domain-containing protein [Pedobacter polaris]TKC10704.1 response regulator transcription factor [Pedobacter polaris]
MEKLKCIIVEDEPLAADILKDYVSEVPFLELEGIYINALYALEAMQRTKIDVIFLDIHLPKLKGFDFIKTLKEKPKIIITTAYREYALEGYELNISDYLLKPIKFTRFLTAVNRLENKEEIAIQPQQNGFISDKDHLVIISNKSRVKIYLDEILYIESKKKYIQIFTSNLSYQTRMPLNEIEEKLNKLNFVRIHRSFIVAKQKVHSCSAVKVELEGHTVPIGRSYKEYVQQILR